jgi:hypothetical protein
MRRIALDDTDYAGTLVTYGHTGAKSQRERRGKYRANAKRGPAWEHNETLEVLRLSRTTAERAYLRAARKARKRTLVTVANVPEVARMGQSEYDAKHMLAY